MNRIIYMILDGGNQGVRRLRLGVFKNDLDAGVLFLKSLLCHLSEIKRTASFFDGNAFNRMRVNHGGSDIAVPQQLLNRADIKIGYLEG